ncbi:RNA-binding protein MEX3B-like [Micropterus dolomieu]|uniref:RNA-binding protein MEX3B-like n=1 Tax=Micropterus dolomieu TaxID=147949 RepID=UPI001E8D05F1|nr:RNA-binding protein MEX3B-like [Micropterus dolomieu]
MPSSLFADSSVQGDALDDQRALLITLDQLSLLGLDNDNPLYDNNQEPRKKSVNMTECVAVPSSEHVAEIVGRQGPRGANWRTHPDVVFCVQLYMK